MKYSELIDNCIEIRRTWNPVTVTLDSHADDFLRKFSDENEKVFIRQVFFGTYRYEEFIKVFNTALFKRSPAETNRNDAPLNAVFIYLVCFRLDELPYEEFKKMVFSQNPVKIHVLFQFLFNVDLLHQHVREEWSKLYDADYIDETIIGGIEKRIEKVGDLLATISMRATGKVSDFVSSLAPQHADKGITGKSWKPTEPEPFKLTECKVKALPQPILIPKVVKSNPVPDNIYKTNLKEIEDQKKKRKDQVKEDIQKRYTESKAKRFEFETEKRPTNLDKVKQEVEARTMKENEKKTFYKPVPEYDHSDIDIRTNAATILKEEVILKKARQEEEDYVKQVEMNMRDSSEFENWKKGMQDKDSLEKLELQEKRRVEMQLARESAMKAVESKFTANKENVKAMKEQSKEHKKEYEDKVAEEFEYKKQLKDGVVEQRELVDIEKQRVANDNKKKHDEIKKDKKERWFMKKEEEEVEKKKRAELISKIRELENRPKPAPKPFDDTETMGYGLLEEMPIVQLKERLEQVRKAHDEEVERNRIENIKKKEEKEKDLKNKAAEIQASRKANAALHAEKKEKKIREAEEEKRRVQEIREKSLLEVHSKVMEKKQNKQTELERIAKELREIKLKRQYLNADKAVLEAKAWQSLEEGAEREIKMRQNSKLLEQEGVESIKLKERKILAQRATTEVETKLDFLREYEKTWEEAKQHNEVLFREEREAKHLNHEEIRKYEAAHMDNMATRDPFKTKITQMSLTNAKSTLSNKLSVSSREEIVLPPSKYSDMRENHIIIEEKPERLES